MQVKFTIDNVEAIHQAFRDLPAKEAPKVIRSALRAAIKPFSVEVKRLTPRDTGRLAESTKVRARKTKKRGQIGIVVIQGLGYQSQFPGGFVNFGTVRIEGRHYFERAFESKREIVTTMLSETIRQGIIAKARALLAKGKN